MSALTKGTIPPFVPNPAALPEVEIDYDALVTEDHKPVERILIEKLYRLLTHPLYANWPGPGDGRSFLMLANVGWFYQEKTPAVVPDCLLSLGVTCPPNLHVKQGHSYYSWAMGKPPDALIEAVSDKLGDEDGLKMELYARQGVPYYAIYDPDHYLSTETLRTYQLSGGSYQKVQPGPWSTLGLGLRLWDGVFEGHRETWLRWCDAKGEIIPTAEERTVLAEERIRSLEEELRRLKAGQPPT